MSALNVDSAIGAHRAWKGRLEYMILGLEEGHVDVDAVCDDRKCLLGLWLFGDGREYAAWASYPALVDIHRRFHEEACKVVAAFRQGKQEEASALLEGEFDRLSVDIVALLKDLRTLLNARPH